MNLHDRSRAGFSFPDKVFEAIPIISLDQKEREILQELSQNRSIHFGESEGLSIAKHRDAIFLSNDSKAVDFAIKMGINALSLMDILLLLAIRRVVDCAEMNDLLQDLEEKDNTIIKGKSQILEML